MYRWTSWQSPAEEPWTWGLFGAELLLGDCRLKLGKFVGLASSLSDLLSDSLQSGYKGRWPVIKTLLTSSSMSDHSLSLSSSELLPANDSNSESILGWKRSLKLLERIWRGTYLTTIIMMKQCNPLKHFTGIQTTVYFRFEILYFYYSWSASKRNIIETEMRVRSVCLLYILLKKQE